MSLGIARFFRAVLLAACSLLVVHGQNAAATMDDYVQAHAKVRSFMGTVLVAKGGKILLEKGYGSANLELNVPNTPVNKFRLGSITKQFTAASIMQLEEQGKISLDDPACKYVDNCPAAWKPVTIRHLLTHTSGIPSYTGLPSFPTPKFMRVPLSPLEVVLLTKDKPLEFQPGEKFAYDNTGYVLLGFILEKISGRSYADYLKQHIFDPLDMAASGYDDTRAILPGRVAGYDHTPNGYRNADYIDMSLPHAAGSLYSTVGDLYRWDRALYTEKIVSKRSYAAMTTPVKNDYGFGFMLAPMFKHKQVGHGGGINGFSTCINRFPDDDAVVIVLSNVINANACGVGAGLTGLLFGEQVDVPQDYKQISIDPKLLERYTGNYRGDKLDLSVTADKGHLYAQLKGQPSLEVFPYSDHQFFLKIIDATLDFASTGDKAGQVTLHQNGMRIRFERVE